MVKFSCSLAEPGLFAVDVSHGFQAKSKMVRLLVGPDEIEYSLPLRYLSHISFFDKAFGGDFVEAATSTMSLPDEDPKVFAIFITWLYRGIREPTLWNETLETWSRFLVMADKWNLTDLHSDGALAVVVAKVMNNLFVSSPERFGDDMKLWWDILEAYRILAPFRFRFVFVHAFWADRRDATAPRARKMYDIMRHEPQFFLDLSQWEEILRRVTCLDVREYNMFTDIGKAEASAHSADRVLIEYLEYAMRFPEILSPCISFLTDIESLSKLTGPERDAECWAYLKEFLEE